MEYIIGIDIALRKTGLAVLQLKPLSFLYDNTLVYSGSMADGGTYVENEQFYEFLKDTIVPHIPRNTDRLMWVIEGMPRYGHYTTAIKISLARANVYRLIADNWPSSTVLVPRVYTWKKDLLGKSNAGKELTKTLLENTYSYIPGLTDALKAEDTMDAAALTLWGLFYGNKS